MTKLEQMREVFARLEGSGLSMKAFAAREGILDLPGAPGIASLMLLPPAECGSLSRFLTMRRAGTSVRSHVPSRWRAPSYRTLHMPIK